MNLFLRIGALLLIAIGAGILFFADWDQETAQPVVVQANSTPEPTPTVAPPELTPEPTPEPPPVNTSPIVRLRVPRVGINAPIVILGVDPDGTMQSPKTPTDVAWYNFAARPGAGSNVVFAGHVDYVNYGAAVFWRLRDMRAGDEIIVELEDGTDFVYRVLSLTSYDADSAPVAEIVGPTETEAITLITCTGVFDRSVREYNKRLVIRGERVAGS